MIKNFTVAENVILREHQKQPYSRYGFLNLRGISSHSDELIKKFNVKTPSHDTLVKTFPAVISRGGPSRELSATHA